MGCGRVKTTRNINLFADFHVFVPTEPVAAGEPARGEGIVLRGDGIVLRGEGIVLGEEGIVPQ